MHIEPGIVDGAKMVLAWGTGAAALGHTVRLVKNEVMLSSAPAFLVRAVIGAIGTLVFFEVLPHFPVGVSEVHFILATTLFLLLGAGASSCGLAIGLAAQGLFFAPSDLPMYAVNLTTLLVPLFVVDALARRIIPHGRAFVDLDYATVLKLSVVYQGGVVAWVTFWVFYGQGFGADTLQSLATFAATYIVVIAIEPVVDLAVLAGAKTLRSDRAARALAPRLYAEG